MKSEISSRMTLTVLCVSESALTLPPCVSLGSPDFTMHTWTDGDRPHHGCHGEAPLSLPVLTAAEVEQELGKLPAWEIRDGWLRRAYSTPGWSHTLLLAGQIAFLAEAAWHDPDLELGYARLVVKLQTHKVRGLTSMDFELARKIEEQVTWLPGDASPLDGYPKKWIH